MRHVTPEKGMQVRGKCQGCRDGEGFDLPFAIAFQPILNLRTGRVFAHEALVRGPAGEGAASVFGQVTPANRYAFDQQCRVKSIEQAAKLDLPRDGASLSINFLPNAVYEAKACIRLTLATAERHRFPLDRIIFEFTEEEQMDTRHLLNILRAYREMGFRTALDDFGAGFAGLGLLAKFQPDIVKMDMHLMRGIDSDPVRRAILRGMLRILADLGITPVCEGIETEAECRTLLDMGVELMQGYLLGRPSLGALTPPNWPASLEPAGLVTA
jgi:EAL domain-containing protein (putative c-di-GMP-specific phosphodiesterase class I)